MSLRKSLYSLNNPFNEEQHFRSFFMFQLSVLFQKNLSVAADRLALAGFRFVGIESAPDMVQCDYCYGRLQRWELSDDPLHEHLRHYSTCDFLLPLKQATKNPQVKTNNSK